MKIEAWSLLAAIALAPLLAGGGSLAQDSPYKPLEVPEIAVEQADFTVEDASRGRSIPVRAYFPASRQAAPVILFSHGLGGSREGYKYLSEHWAKRGYLCVCVQHPGSDSSVWKGKPLASIMSEMKSAANLENFMLRMKDVPAVIDQLERWNKEQGSQFYGRMDLSRIGMSGHSFGALTTQGVSGEQVRGKAPFTDPRIKAAMMFSPSSPKNGESPEEAFGGVKIPWMIMTGTEDVSPIGNTDVKSRLGVYPALPPGGKYELVLSGAKHSAFSDRVGPTGNPNHHKAILALSAAFWDAWLKGDAAAKAWLDGDAPRSVLEKDDRWQRK